LGTAGLGKESEPSVEGEELTHLAMVSEKKRRLSSHLKRL
jgi:hypothetical protein